MNGRESKRVQKPGPPSDVQLCYDDSLFYMYKQGAFNIAFLNQRIDRKCQEMIEHWMNLWL
jgi:hypothetical protein